MGAVIDLCCEKAKVPKSQKRKYLKRISAKNDPPPAQVLSLQQTCPTQTIKQSPQKLQKLQQLQKLQRQKLEQKQDQFYDIDEFVQQRQSTNLQPQKITHKNFQTAGLIGQGAFGSVFLVHYKDVVMGENSQDLAMKRVPRQLTCSKKVMDSLKLQRHILATSTSPFITSLKYAFTDRHYLYLVMQFASGGDAGRFVQKGQLQKEFGLLGQNGVRFLLACTVMGLEYIHSQQMVYRDLKPQNILLFANGYAKLSDFGLVRIIPDQHIKLKTHAGTALYNAPQMVLQQGYAKPVDFWALGVLAYELTTGQTPFKLEDVITKSRFRRVAQEEEVRRTWGGHKLGAQLTNLIGQLLRFKPEERLGVRGWNQIKQHKFFNKFDWKALQEGRMDSPLEQIVKKNSVQVKTTKQVIYSIEQKYSDWDNEDEEWHFDHQKK